MDFIIITGMSGAGKSKIAAVLEDIGYYCVDNMPVVLIPRFAELCLASRGRYEKVALVTDVRGGETFDNLFESLDYMREMGCEYRIIFVEAAVDVIIHRYKESRRRHPLAEDGVPIEVTAAKENEMLECVRERANHIIDTTALSVAALRERIIALVSDEPKQSTILVTVVSFGFKYGLPIEADLVFDVRFLPNPYYIQELRPNTGNDPEVRSYVLSWQQTHEFLGHLYTMVDFLLPYYIEEGKTSVVIAIGCTGGKHRSVALSNELCDHIGQSGYKTASHHRDIDRK